MDKKRAVPTPGQALTQLRRHPRVRVSAPFPCSFSVVGLKRRWPAVDPGDLGVVYDVSTKGARVMTEAVISPGDRITLSLQLPNHPSATCIELATVRWGKEQTYGVEFEGLSPAVDTRLQKFMDHSSRLVAAPTS
ncbi:MAG: PilZ domain-containing protein [Nitrospira sp.]|nr:PilZ domain-containing protein [Nitrospira sp.]MBH0196239.1 PilZ domain-containing protein [Nitrospira sp.]